MGLVKAFLTHKITILIFRVIIGVVFIWASLDKIAHVSDFSRAVHNYKIVPIVIENIIAISLPWMELLAGLFLIIGYKVKGAAALISFFLMIFIVAIVAALARNLDISCGCFDTKEGMKISFDLVFRDILLLIMSICITFIPQKQRGMVY